MPESSLSLPYFGALSLARVGALGKLLSWKSLAGLDPSHFPRLSPLAGALVLLLPLLAGQQLLSALWRFWDWSDFNQFRSRSPYSFTWPFLYFALAFVLLTAFAPIYAFQAVGRLWTVRAGLFGAVIMAGGGAISMFAIRGWWVRWKAWRSRKRHNIKSGPPRRLRDADRLPWTEIVIATVLATLLTAPLVLLPPWVVVLAVVPVLALYWLLRRRLRRKLSRWAAVGPVPVRPRPATCLTLGLCLRCPPSRIGTPADLSWQDRYQNSYYWRRGGILN